MIYHLLYSSIHFCSCAQLHLSLPLIIFSRRICSTLCKIYNDWKLTRALPLSVLKIALHIETATASASSQYLNILLITQLPIFALSKRLREFIKVSNGDWVYTKLFFIICRNFWPGDGRAVNEKVAIRFIEELTTLFRWIVYQGQSQMLSKRM